MSRPRGWEVSNRICCQCAQVFVPYFRVQKFCNRKCYERWIPHRIRRTYRSPNRARDLSPTEISWLACAIDTEGSLDGRTSRQSAIVRICITNTSMEFLDRVKSVSGCGNIYDHMKGTPNRKACFRWVVYGQSARSILRQVTPYLIIKREKSIQILKDQERG